MTTLWFSLCAKGWQNFLMPAFRHPFGSVNDLCLELSRIFLHHLCGTCVFLHPPVVHGSWSHWSDWSECEACTHLSTRTRECNSPPSRFGGLPCIGERRQSRGCHDNFTVCSGWHYKWLHLSYLALLKCTKCMNDLSTECCDACLDVHHSTKCFSSNFIHSDPTSHFNLISRLSSMLSL